MKFFIVLIFCIFTLYGGGLDFSGLGNLGDIKNSKQVNQKITPDDAKEIKKRIIEIERTQKATPDEFLMLAITYEAGDKLVGINKNVYKSLYYYEKSLNGGIVYSGIRGSVLAYENNDRKKAYDILHSALDKDNITYEEGYMLNKLGAIYNLNDKHMQSGIDFLSEMAFKFDDSEAAYLGFNISYYGIGMKKNFVIANKFINAACNSKKITKNIATFCATSPILQK